MREQFALYLYKGKKEKTIYSKLKLTKPN